MEIIYLTAFGKQFLKVTIGLDCSVKSNFCNTNRNENLELIQDLQVKQKHYNMQHERVRMERVRVGRRRDEQHLITIAVAVNWAVATRLPTMTRRI